MDPTTSRRYYTLWLVYSADLGQYILLALGRSTDPTYVAVADDRQTALESLTPTPNQGRDGAATIRWALEETLRQDPDALETDGRPLSTWDLSRALWQDAQKWKPYRWRIDDQDFHIAHCDERGEEHHLDTCPAFDREVREMLADFARMGGRSPFDVGQLHAVYYEAKSHLLTEEA